MNDLDLATKNSDSREWKPTVSIGIFHFEKKLNLDELKFEYHEVESPSDDTSYKIYEVREDGLRFVLENEVLVSVECFTRIIYKDENLIGMKARKVFEVFDGKCHVSDVWDNGEQIDCDDFGAIFWIEREVVESVSVSI
ncbi:MAG: hypothetical protein GY705_03280 [Bacteroidetes bacterium]|nr:hypothetical protein [Bacteroidota bacterium]